MDMGPESSEELKDDVLWIEEAMRRLAEIEIGVAELIPADEVFARARERLT